MVLTNDHIRMGLKIREAQGLNLGKADQKESSGNRKSVFQMLGRMDTNTNTNTNTNTILITFSRRGCLLLCLLGSVPHTEAAPRLHIFLQVSQVTAALLKLKIS